MVAESDAVSTTLARWAVRLAGDQGVVFAKALQSLNICDLTT